MGDFLSSRLARHRHSESEPTGLGSRESQLRLNVWVQYPVNGYLPTRPGQGVELRCGPPRLRLVWYQPRTTESDGGASGHFNPRAEFEVERDLGVGAGVGVRFGLTLGVGVRARGRRG